MHPTLPQTTHLPTSSQGRRGADARPVHSVTAFAGRASGNHLLYPGDEAVSIAHGGTYRDYTGDEWFDPSQDEFGYWHLTSRCSGTRERFYANGKHYAAPGSVSDLVAEVEAEETAEQLAAHVQDVLRREADFAEPGEMERREREEASAHAVSIAVTIGVTAALIGLVVLATVLVMGWAS